VRIELRPSDPADEESCLFCLRPCSFCEERADGTLETLVDDGGNVYGRVCADCCHADAKKLRRAIHRQIRLEQNAIAGAEAEIQFLRDLLGNLNGPIRLAMKR
jgi:Zn-finger protein